MHDETKKVKDEMRLQTKKVKCMLNPKRLLNQDQGVQNIFSLTIPLVEDLVSLAALAKSFVVIFFSLKNKSIANDCVIPRHWKHFHSPIISNRFSTSWGMDKTFGHLLHVSEKLL